MKEKKSIIRRTIDLEEAAQWMVRMAAVDGVLSPREMIMLIDFAQRYGLPAVPLLAAARPDKNVLPEVKPLDMAAENGLQFEYHIVSLMRYAKGMSLLGWTGVKFYDGIFAPDVKNPDLHLSFNSDFDFYVECKWRNNWMKDSKNRDFMLFNVDKLDHYSKFANETGSMVLIALGIGDTGIKPQDFYILPLTAIKKRFIFRSYLNRYRIKDTPAHFAEAVRRHIVGRVDNNIFK